MPVRIEVQSFGGPATPPLQLRTLRVRDSAGMHLMAKAQTEPSKGYSFNEGDPVMLVWGWSSSPFLSSMYVHRVSDISAPRHAQSVWELTLVGTSWPLKSAQQRVFRGQSAEQILAEIARSHSLTHDFSASNRTFSNFVSRVSDWAALRDLAERVGGTLRVDGGKVRIFDMNAGLAHARRAPVFSATSKRVGKVEVTSKRSDTRRHEVLTVHPSTGTLQSVDDSMPFDTDDLVLTDFPTIAVDSPRGAQDALKSMRLNSRFRETAKIEEMRGEPRLRPGEVLGLRGMTPKKNGVWTVTGASHRLNRSNFVSAMELGRSSEHPRTTTLNSDRLTSVAGLSSSRPVLRQGRWVAS